MATQDGLKLTVSGGFPGEKRTQRLTYDFGLQGGLTADTFEMGELGEKMCITNAYVMVETAGAGATAVVNIGYDASGTPAESADVDAWVNNAAGAVASLTDDTIIRQAAGEDIVLNGGTKVLMTIATAALTAGRWHLYLEGYAVA